MNTTAEHDTVVRRLTLRLDEAAQRSRDDPEAARRDLETLIADAETAEQSAVAARARYALARVLVSLGSAASALTLIEQVDQDLRSIGEIDEAIRTNLGRMHVLDDLGRHSEAVAVGRAMLTDLAERDDTDEIVWLRAAAGENVGVALGYLGRHAEALDSYASAVAYYEHLGLTTDAARGLANRGVELTELAHPAEAIQALEDAYEQFVVVEDRLWQGLCQTNLSEAWIAAGRYLEAFGCLDAAESALEGLDQTTEWLRAQLGRASCLESLHLDVEALDLYDELVEPLAEAGLLDDLGKVHLGRGTILARAGGTVDVVLDAFESAVASFESTGNDPMLARACLAAAPLHPEPPTMIDRAVTLVDGGDRPADLAFALLALAEQFEHTDSDRAAAALERADRLIEPIGAPALRWRLHHRTGRLHRLTGRTEDARSEFEAAIGILGAIRSSVDRDGIRQRFDGARAAAADDLVELLLDTGDPDAAFAFADSIRSRGLLERLAGPIPAGVEAPRDELHSVYDRLLAAHGPLVDELAARARRLERSSPGTADVGDGMSVATPSVGPDRIVYHTLGDEIVAFVAGDQGEVVAVRKLGESSGVASLLARLDAHWRRFAHPDVVERHAHQLERATVDVLRRLHDVLLGPLADHVAGDGPLTIVADGAVGAVPFAALHDGDGHLVRRRAIRQTPSIAVDERLPSRHRRHRSVLALGTNDPFAPLAASEARLVGKLWPTATVRLGEMAEAKWLFDTAADHDVVHIAGHGMFRPDAPEFSAIRLADRWVTAAEIARLQLDGQLVVLSTCDSGRRRVGSDMREVVGLPRAFLAAGAGGVIVNLWPADDHATTSLTTTLHRRLVAGEPPAEALRGAQLDTMADHPHPYYWGAPTLIGGGDAASAAASPIREAR